MRQVISPLIGRVEGWDIGLDSSTLNPRFKHWFCG